VLAETQLSFDLATLINQHPTQTKAGRAALTKAQFDQPALTGKDLGREFPAVFTGHGAFDAFDYC
jgi:hypothetical protein